MPYPSRVPALLALVVGLTLCTAVPAGASNNEARLPSRSNAASNAPAPISEPIRYIAADSPADARAKFAALDAGGARARAASVEFGPCTLYPSVMYLRKSTGYRGVGTKPYTKCDYAVASIHHDTDLRYKSFIWWRKAKSKDGGNRGVASYTQKNIEYTCVSSESTAWTGTTAGTIVTNAGRTYYARVYQPVKTLDCGG